MIKELALSNQNRFWGETTAVLALFLDNLGVLTFLSYILMFTFNERSPGWR